MNESARRELDAAIDRVAARMVAVPEDSSLLSRTMARLPERQVTPWFMTFRMQIAAAAAALLIAFVFARPSQEPASTDAARVAVAIAPMPGPRIPDPGSRLRQGDGGQARIPDPLPAIARQVPPRRAPVVLDRPDHERSLAPVDAIDALELIGIAPPAMELDATTAPAPLVLPELALDTKGDS